MKNKVLRMVSGVMLSAMLVVAAAYPARAAVNECQPHVIENGTKRVTGYPNADECYHQVKAVVSGKCSVCKNHVSMVITYSELHSIRADGTCVCGFKPRQ